MAVPVIGCFVLLTCLVIDSVGSELLLVHVMFRHGEKTADTKFMPPTDPYKNDTFYPYGPGQLTNEGKKTMYNFGKILRKRYDKIVDDMYMPGLVDAWTTNFDRTQASLQIVLTALFPPNGALVWDEHLNWQPIPYNFLPVKYDDLFLGALTEEYLEEYYQHSFFGEGKKITDEAKPVFSYIQKHTNSTMNSFNDILYLHMVLLGEENYGLTLPEWTKKIYPQPLDDLLNLAYQMHMGTWSLRRRIVGRLMKKILEDSENRIKNKTNCKLHLYSTHDVSLMHILIFLELMYNHQPGYSACLVLELHEENGGYFLEAHYKDDKHSNFQLMRFPSGEKRVYLHHFRDMVEDLFEEGESKSTSKAVSRSMEIKSIYLHLIIMVVYFFRRKHLI